VTKRQKLSGAGVGEAMPEIERGGMSPLAEARFGEHGLNLDRGQREEPLHGYARVRDVETQNACDSDHGFPDRQRRRDRTPVDRIGALRNRVATGR